MTAYIRRSIIISPGCQNDSEAEMGACGALLTYGFLSMLYFPPAAAGGTVSSLLELVQPER